MSKEQILYAIRRLASKGLYGWLYEYLSDGGEDAEDFLKVMEQHNFADMVDMVIWLEKLNGTNRV